VIRGGAEEQPVLEGLSEIVPDPGVGRAYEQEMRPGIADADGSGRCRLDAMARWLQDIAYADLVDAGFEGRGAWIVRRTRMRVESFPRFGEEISLRTFCSGIGRFSAERRTSIRGRGAAVETVALWICLDPERGRPMRFPADFTSAYEKSAEGRDANVRLRHPEPPEDAERSSWTFRASEMDPAGHINNSHYWAPLEEDLAAGAEPERIDAEIEYREPAMPGEVALLRTGIWLWIAGTDGAVHASMVTRLRHQIAATSGRPS
jgi:acyl-ACP thioesterase